MRNVESVKLKVVQAHEERTGANLRLGTYKMWPASEFRTYRVTLDEDDLPRLFMIAEFWTYSRDGQTEPTSVIFFRWECGSADSEEFRDRCCVRRIGSAADYHRRKSSIDGPIPLAQDFWRCSDLCRSPSKAPRVARIHSVSSETKWSLGQDFSVLGCDR